MNSFLRKIKRNAIVCASMAAIMSLSPWNNMTISNPIRINAETGEIETESKYQYVSDLKLSIADDSKTALNQLRDAGYTPAQYDLNTGGDRWVYLGYKTSTSVIDAITSVKAMNMITGYEELNYRDFLSENAKGLPDTVAGFQASIHKMKENLFANDPLAKYAYDNLNLLCVPESSEAKTGPGLGDYLLDNYDNYNLMEDMVLVLQTNTLTYINDQLAIGCSGNYINENEDEYMLTWESDPFFLDKLTLKIEEKFDEIVYSDNSEEEIIDLIAKDSVKVGSMVSQECFETVINDDVIEELAKARTHIYYDGYTYSNLYQILTSDSNFLLSCVVESLPYTIEPKDFISFLVDYVNDIERKVPNDVPNLPEVVSPVFADVVDYVNNLVGDPYNLVTARRIIEEYAGPVEELDFFIELANDFLDEYYNQLWKAQDVLEDYDGELSLGEILQKLSAKNEEDAANGDANKLYHDAFFYLMPCEILKSYKFKENPFLHRFNEYGEDVSVTDLFGLLEYMSDAYLYETEEIIAQSVAAMFLQAMDVQDVYLLKTSSIPVYTMTASINPEKNSMINDQFEENKNAIIDAYKSLGFKEDECSVWFGTSKNLLEESLVCQTDSTIRQKIIDDEFQNSLLEVQNDKDYMDFISDALENCGLALAVAGVVMAVGQAVSASIMGSLSFFTLMQVGFFSTVGLGSTFGLSAGAIVASMAAFVGAILFVLLFVALIVFLVLMFTLKPPTPDVEEHERVSIPKIMIDCQRENNGNVKRAIRYDVVQATDGKDADLNGYRDGDDDYDEAAWNALYYSKSTEIGSPLIVTENGTFVRTTPSSEGPALSVPVSTFGANNAYDLNNQHPDSDKHVYLHYFTIDSVNGTVPDDEKEGKYLERIVMATSPKKEVALDALKLKGEDYHVIEYDLTQGMEDYTFIAYKTTNNPKEAVTDIRAAAGVSSYNFSWGDSSNPYICVYGASEVSCPITTPSDSRIEGEEDGDPSELYWNLYCSYSPNVGDPILASTLSIITTLDELPDGYEYARWFSGGAFDFAVQKEDSKNFGIHRFLEYASDPEFRHYKDETKYLAGFMFFSYSSSWISGSPKGLDGYCKEIGCTLIKNDLTKGFMNDEADVTYMGYATTTNPKKAVTDIGVFTSEPDSAGVISDNINRYDASFESCVTIYAGDHGYARSDAYDKERMFRNSHAYITNIETEAYIYEDKEDYEAIRPRGLYCAGPRAGANPILLSDVVFAKKHNVTPSSIENNGNIYSLETLSPIYGGLGTGWTSVHSLYRYFYDQYDANLDLLTPSVNLSLSKDEFSDADNAFYMYFKNGAEIKKRGTYISSLELVGYDTDYESQQDGYNYALYMAVGAGEEIVNLDLPLAQTGSIFFDNENLFYDYEKFGRSHPSGQFIVATYTNSKSRAIGGAIISKFDDATAININYDFSPTPYVYTKGRYDNGHANKDFRFSLYTTRSGDPINRVCITVDDVPQGIKVTDAAITYVTDPNLKKFLTYSCPKQTQYEYVSSHPGSRINNVGIALISYKLSDFISDIKFSSDYATLSEFRTETNLAGYRQLVNASFYYNTNEITVGAAIARTNDPGRALKDIKIFNEDKGKEITINERVYRRLNDKPLIDVSGTSDLPTYFYGTIGNLLEQGKNPKYPNYAERVAITNFGFTFDYVEASHTDANIWNGDPSSTGFTGSFVPSSISDVSKQLFATNENGEDAFVVGDNACVINPLWVFSGQPKRYMQLKVTFINHSGKSMTEYAAGFDEGILTGDSKRDAELGLGSAIAKSPFFLVTIGAGAGALITALCFIFLNKKRKEKGALESEEE